MTPRRLYFGRMAISPHPTFLDIRAALMPTAVHYLPAVWVLAPKWTDIA